MINKYDFGKFTIGKKEYKHNIILLGEEIKRARDLEDHKLKVDDIALLINAKPFVVIIGTGAYGLIKVPKDIVDYVKDRGIPLVIQPTEVACKAYNDLTKRGKKVAAFLHNTC